MRCERVDSEFCWFVQMGCGVRLQNELSGRFHGGGLKWHLTAGIWQCDWCGAWQNLIGWPEKCMCPLSGSWVGNRRLKTGGKKSRPFPMATSGMKAQQIFLTTYKVLFPFSSLLNICDRPGGFDVQSFELCGDDGRSGLFSPPPCASFHQATSQPSERKPDHRRRILWRHAAAVQTVTHTRVWLWTQADTHRHKHTCQHHL